jgi:hypothetical protein
MARVGSAAADDDANDHSAEDAAGVVSDAGGEGDKSQLIRELS